ncbi:MAG: metal-dependent transcriptional regulator [Anaerolineales bacterium]|nr:metal-dependent transcriptional regulator [Anaerolineales bacterium]
MVSISASLTPAIQDYLKQIYALSENEQPASTNALAESLGIAPASVTGMVQKLAAFDPPLVNYHKHRGVTLTSAGERAALEVIRRHRLLETWLAQSLGYTWDEVHEEACRLEHVISEKFEACIAAALGHPQRDPHGDPIPNADLVMPDDKAYPLFSLRPGQQAVVLRVGDESPQFLRHIAELGLVPGARLIISAYSPFDSNLTVQVPAHAPVTLGLAISFKIFVEKIPG